MQTLATGIKRQGTFILCDMNIQTDVRIGNTDVRSLACLFPELVHNGVLYLVSHEFGVAELFREDDGVNGKCLVQSDIFCPVDVFHTFIDIIGRQCLKMFDGFQYADGSVQLEISTIQ